VTLLVKPAVVTAHLVGGLTTMALCWWLSLRVDRTTRPPGERGLRRLAVVGLAVLALQIMLGGWVSTNYSALACPDFPTCQKSFWPEMDFKDAFVLWRGLGIDYEGGVLDHPARVAVHFTHRLGAIVAALLIGVLGWRLWRTASTRPDGVAVVAALLLQLGLGVSIVWLGVPLPVAVAHNGMAALLLLTVLNANQRIRQR
jgi:cytochrome c oxidase assembly protein subunit 15